MRIAIEVPVVEERFPTVIRDALAARRQAALTGVCPACSGKMAGGFHGLSLQHSEGCGATDIAILRLLEGAGIDPAELEFEVVQVVAQVEI